MNGGFLAQELPFIGLRLSFDKIWYLVEDSVSSQLHTDP